MDHENGRRWLDLQLAISNKDYEHAWRLSKELLTTFPGSSAVEVAILVAQGRVEISDSSLRGKLAAQSAAEIESLVSSPLQGNHLRLLGELYYTSGLCRDAAETWRRAMVHDRYDFHTLRLLGISLLELAVNSRSSSPSLMSDRWRRAWADLTSAAWDHEFLTQWATSRCHDYRLPIDARWIPLARQKIINRLDQQLVRQIEHLHATEQQEASLALQRLREEFQTDEYGVEVFANALPHVRMTRPPPRPFPFGLIWYQQQDSAEEARQSLHQLIKATLFVPVTSAGGGEDSSARSMGVLLRQLYSRLAPVRQAVRWGQFELAAKALEHICAKDAQCQVSPNPHYRLTYGAPRCCDPQCSRFARCNPGYSEPSSSSQEMEEDAYRLSIFVHLAMAGQWLHREPPEYTQAARHWVLARNLATVIDETAEFEQLVAGQVMARIIELRREPQVSRTILDTAMGSVASNALRARFADSLIDLGIEQCEAENWDDGVHDLLLGWTLNKESDRAARNLLLALQRLADVQARRLDWPATIRSLETLVYVWEKADNGVQQEESIAPLREWAIRQLSQLRT